MEQISHLNVNSLSIYRKRGMLPSPKAWQARENTTAFSSCHSGGGEGVAEESERFFQNRFSSLLIRAVSPESD